MGAPGLGWVMMVVGVAWWVLVVIALVWLIRVARGPRLGHGTDGGAGTARALLDDQFARGEVAVADYRERRRHLDTR